jgi:hypothetical protein
MRLGLGRRALLLFVAAAAAPATAQCFLTGALISNYGMGCSVQANPIAITATFTPGSCLFTATWTASPSCCNVFYRGSMLAIATQQANLPLPNGCTLYVQPLVAFDLGATRTFTVPIPTAAMGATVYLQAANYFFFTLCPCLVYEFTNGLSVTFF